MIVRRLRCTIVVALSCALLSGCAALDQYRLKRSQLTETPPRENPSQPYVPASSLLEARFELPIDELAKYLDGQIPKEERTGVKNGEDVCIDNSILGVASGLGIFSGMVPGETCSGTHHDLTVRKTGNLRVEPAPDDFLVVSVPLKVTGRVGFRGDLAGLTGLDWKRIELETRATFAVSLTVDDDWQLRPQIRSLARIPRKATLEIIDGVPLDLTPVIAGELNDSIRELAKNAEKDFDRNQLKDTLKSVWKVYSYEMVTPSGKPYYANVVPQLIATRGIEVSEDRLALGISISALTEVSSDPIPSLAIPPLPTNSKQSITKSKLKLTVPVTAEYEFIQSELSTSFTEPLKLENEKGETTAKLCDWEVYPFKDKVVIGARFQADLPNSLFDAKGRFYVYGTPTVDPVTETLRFSDIQFARRVDSVLWTEVSVLFEEKITQALEEASTVNYSEDLRAIERRFSEQLAQETGGNIRVSATNVAAFVERVVTSEDALIAEAALEADVSLQVQLLTGR